MKLTLLSGYRHFEDKESLLAAIAQDGFLRLVQTQKDALGGESSPMERLRRLGRTYVEFAVTHPAHFRVMFGAEMSDKTKYPDLAAAAKATFLPVVEEAERCQQLGKLRKGEPLELAQILWSAVHGLSMLSINQQIESVSDKKFEALAIALGEAIIRGLAL